MRWPKNGTGRSFALTTAGGTTSRAYRTCREAVGPDFTLMADPVAAYNHHQALRMGRELEKLGYYWFEEPLFDVDFHGLRKLAASLDIPVCGTLARASTSKPGGKT